MHFFMRTLHGTQTVRCPHGRNTTSARASEHTMHSASSMLLLLLPLHIDDADKLEPLLSSTTSPTQSQPTQKYDQLITRTNTHFI